MSAPKKKKKKVKEVKEEQHLPKDLVCGWEEAPDASASCHSGLRADSSAARFLIKDDQAQASVV